MSTYGERVKRRTEQSVWHTHLQNSDWVSCAMFVPHCSHPPFPRYETGSEGIGRPFRRFGCIGLRRRRYCAVQCCHMNEAAPSETRLWFECPQPEHLGRWQGGWNALGMRVCPAPVLLRPARWRPCISPRSFLAGEALVSTTTCILATQTTTDGMDSWPPTFELSSQGKRKTKSTQAVRHPGPVVYPGSIAAANLQRQENGRLKWAFLSEYASST